MAISTPAADIPLLDRPVFIVGPLRSGTTVLRLMLDAHPRLGLFAEFEEAVSQLGDSGWVDLPTFYDWLKIERMARDKNFDVNESLDYPSLVRDFLRQSHDRYGPEVDWFGGVVHSRFDRCPDIWPEARYIHLLRDPRDVARSAIGMGWVGNVYDGCDYWLGPEVRWDQLRERVPAENLFEISFEDLITDTPAVLAKICDFLGVPYDAQMMTYHEGTTYAPPDPTLTEQWRRKLSPRDIRRVEYRCGDLMVKRGYQLSGLPALRPSALERHWQKISSRLVRNKFALDRYGPSLFLKRFIAKRWPSESFRERVQLQVNDVDTANLK